MKRYQLALYLGGTACLAFWLGQQFPNRDDSPPARVIFRQQQQQTPEVDAAILRVRPLSNIL